MAVTKTKFDEILENIDSMRISKYIDDDIYDISDKMGVTDATFKTALINAKISISWEDEKKFKVNVKLNDNIWYMIPEEIQKIINDAFSIGVFDHVLSRVFGNDDFGRRNTSLYMRRVRFYMLDIYYTAILYIKKNMANIRVINNNAPKHPTSLIETYRDELQRKFNLSSKNTPRKSNDYLGYTIPWFDTTLDPPINSMRNPSITYGSNMSLLNTSNLRSDEDLAGIITSKEIADAVKKLMKLQFSMDKDKNYKILKAISSIKALFALEPIENGFCALVFGMDSDAMESVLLPDLESIGFIKVTIGDNLVRFITNTAGKEMGTEMSAAKMYSIAYKNRGGILSQIMNSFISKINEGNCPKKVKISEFSYSEQEEMDIFKNLTNFFTEEPGGQWIPA